MENGYVQLIIHMELHCLIRGKVRILMSFAVCLIGFAKKIESDWTI